MENLYQPRLFACLVAASHYPFLPGKQLPGSLNDIASVERLLNEDFLKSAFREVHIKKLISNEAVKSNPADLPSKQNLVAGFEKFLAQAEKGDTVLFYYSGHGIREKTDIPQFKAEEMDGHPAGLVCWDYNPEISNTGSAVLSDKEIRYFIRHLAHDETGARKANVVAIFDCCNSGENTRSVLSEALPARSRQIDRGAIKGRKPEEYIFYNDERVMKGLRENEPLEAVLPQGDHVMLAACRDVELAWEGNDYKSNLRLGAFTAALTDILYQFKGDVSYHELHTRILNRMRFVWDSEAGSRDTRQTPQLYIRSSSPADRYKRFLSNELKTQQTHFPVEYFQRERQWRIGAGAMHGISPNQVSFPSKVKVTARGNQAPAFEARISNVFPTYSILEWTGQMPDAGLSCQGLVEGLIQQPISVFIGGELEPERNAAIASFRVQLDKDPKAMINLADNEMNADYTLWAAKDGFYTYLPFDRKRPLLNPIGYNDAFGKPSPGEKAKLAFNDFIQISKWEFLRNLEHQSGESAAQSPIEFRLIEAGDDGQENRIYPAGNRFTFKLTPGKPKRKIRFEIVNHGTEQMYCSLVYMPQNFGFLATEDAGFMDRPQRGLGRGDILYSKVDPNTTEKYLNLLVSEYISNYNWPGENNYLKLIFSNTPFDITAFHLDPLPAPGEDSSRSRGSLGFEEPDMPQVNWEIKTFELYVTNPNYQPES
jgi:hypothetical protein